MVIALAGAMFFTDCARPVPPKEKTAVIVPDGEIEGLWQAALAVLPRLDLFPERQDRAAGIIETRPTTSQHFFEGWRHDVNDPYSFAQSSFQTIQRKATVRFIREGGRDRWRVAVVVDVTRLHLSERQATATSAGLQLYTAVLPTSEGQRETVAAATSVESLGRDGAMETYILDRILRVAQTGDFEYVQDSQDAG